MKEPRTAAPSRADRILIGIDPGLLITGYGVLAIEGNRPTLVEAGVVRTMASQALEQRLVSLYQGIREVLADCQPDLMIVEDLYSKYKHPLTAILMGHARGAIYLAAGEAQVPVVSYAARQVKRTLTGSGTATKEQMQRAVKQRLGLKEKPQPPDVADALALVLCHTMRSKAEEVNLRS